jgi:hypothetical protein
MAIYRMVAVPGLLAAAVLAVTLWALVERRYPNNGYYHLPFLFALVAWEALQRERPPVLAAIASGLVWLTVLRLADVISPDAKCAAYLAWAARLATMAYATFRGRYAISRSASTATSATTAPATA